MAETRDDLKARLDLADAVDAHLAVAWADYEAGQAAHAAARPQRRRGLATVAVLVALVPSTVAAGGIAWHVWTKPWFLLLGSYQSREFAEKEAADLSRKAAAILKGRSVVIREVRLRDRLFHRVLIEPPTTRADAYKMCAGLFELGIKNCNPIRE